MSKGNVFQLVNERGWRSGLANLMGYALFPFWNRQQARLRALWRLVLQSVAAQILLAGLAFAALPFLDFSTLTELDEAVNEGVPPAWVFAVVVGLSLIATLVTVGLAGRLLDRRRFVTFGFHFDRDWWLDFAFGLGLGAVLMGLIFAVELAAGWVTVTGRLYLGAQARVFVPGIIAYLFAFVCIGISEELFYRGYHVTNLAEGLNFAFLGPRGAVVVALALSSAFFGVDHFANPNATLVSSLNIALGGVLLGVGYVLTGELAIPIGLHITWNFFQSNVFGFPVSGLVAPSRTVSVLATEQGGPVLWTGGAFGPEAGLLGLGAMLLGILLAAGWVRVRRGSVGLLVSLAEAPDRSGPS